MKVTLQILFVLTAALCISCENESDYLKNNISIRTDDEVYVVEETIKVFIQNNFDYEIQIFFSCWGSGYTVFYQVERLENHVWINRWIPICTFGGPPYFWEPFSSKDIKEDSLFLWEIGRYRMVAKFIIKDDTIDFYSNEFLVQSRV